jgi:hypothetical protein
MFNGGSSETENGTHESAIGKREMANGQWFTISQIPIFQIPISYFLIFTSD